MKSAELREHLIQIQVYVGQIDGTLGELLESGELSSGESDALLRCTAIAGHILEVNNAAIQTLPRIFQKAEWLQGEHLVGESPVERSSFAEHDHSF